MATEKNTDDDRIAVIVTPDLKQKVRMRAAMDGQNMSEFVRDLLFRETQSIPSSLLSKTESTG